MRHENLPFSDDELLNDIIPVDVRGVVEKDYYDYLISSIRALLYERMKDGNETYSINIYSGYYYDIMIKGRNVENIFGVFILGDNYNLSGIEIPDGYKENEIIERFLESHIKAKCFINEQHNSTLIFVDCQPNSSRQETIVPIAAAAGRAMPYFFKPEETTKDSLAYKLAKAIKSSREEFVRLLESVYEEYGVQRDILRKRLNKFEKSDTDQKIKTLTEKIKSCQARIEGYYNDIYEANVTINDCKAQLEFAKSKTASGLLADYLLNHDSIEVIKIDDTSIQIVITGYLDYYDEYQCENFLNNSTLMTGDDMSDNIKGMRNLMKAVYRDKKYKIRTYAEFKIGNNLSLSYNCHSSPSEITDNYLPNPHIGIYSCIGQNMDVLDEYRKRGDFIGYIEQLVYITQNINHSDHVVMDTFMARTPYVDCHCIEAPDGELLTPLGAIARLKEEYGTSY